MADSHTGDTDEKESTTEQKSEDTASTSRRTLLKGIGAFATVGGAGALASESASAAGDFGDYSSPNGEVTMPAGEYTWNDDGLSIGSGDALIGEGYIGEDGIAAIVNHPDLRDLPFALETPTEDSKGFAWNIERVKTLRN